MANDDVAPNPVSAPDEAATKRSFSLLASEMFGDSFKGEVKPDAPEEPKEPQELADEPPPDEAAESEETQENEEQEAPLASVSELVQHYELDPEWFDTLEVADLKVDGRPVKATLKDLKNSYQIQHAAEHRLEEAKTKARQIVQEASAKQEAAQSQFGVVAKLIENVERLLNEDTKAVDPKLRADDPAEWSAKQHELDERRKKIERTKQDAVNAYEAAVKKDREEFDELRQAHLRAEFQTLLEKRPELRDESKLKVFNAKTAEYLISQGFSQQDVMGASNHRLILMADKARLYDELQANTNAAKKKVAQVPKVLKPGAPKPHEQQSKERVEQAQSRLRQSGKLDDAYAFLKARRGGK